ncbi:MAG: triose-phosphate isomerase [Butyricimonas faecihominis]
MNDYVRYKEGGEGILVLGIPFIHLAKVAHNITESSIMVAAQNCATEKAGAYTGEISS